MNKDGKWLEALVEYIEKAFEKPGVSITKGIRQYDEDGIQEAEFDVLVESGNFKWLIECRDRKSQGAAPAAWIEQLVGRRFRFDLNKVTAVSTTGFSDSARKFAKKASIELREVKSLTQEEFSDWLKITHLTNTIRERTLLNAMIGLPSAANEGLTKWLSSCSTADPILRIGKNSELLSLQQVFTKVVSSHPELFDGLVPNRDSKKCRILCKCEGSDTCEIYTSDGFVKIDEIQFEGVLRLIESKSAITYAGEYLSSDSDSKYSQVVMFDSCVINGQYFIPEVHRINDAKELHVCLRNAGIVK